MQTLDGSKTKIFSFAHVFQGQVYEAILDYQPPRSATDEIRLKEGQEVIILGKDKPHKWRVRTRKTAANPEIKEGYAPSAYLQSKNEVVEVEDTALLQAASTASKSGGSASSSSSRPDLDDGASLKDLKKRKK